MIGKLVLGTTKNSSIPVIVKKVPNLYRAFIINNNGLLKNSTTEEIIDFTDIVATQAYSLHRAYEGDSNITGDLVFPDIKRIGDYGLSYAFKDCTNITSVSFPELEDLSWGIVTNGNESWVKGVLSYAFYGCTGITSVSMPKLGILGVPGDTTAYSATRAFYNCTSLTNINLNSVRFINSSNACSYMFGNCTSLETVSLPSLEFIGKASDGTAAGMFYQCSKLTTVSFPKLVACGWPSISGAANMFNGCTRLANVNMPKLLSVGSNAIDNMFNGCTSLTYNPFINLELVYGAMVNTFSNSGIIDGSFKKLLMMASGTSYNVFVNCNAFNKLDFPSLTKVTQTWNYIFGDNSNLLVTDVHFPMLQITPTTINPKAFNLTSSTSSNVTVHFRKDMQSTIETMTGYSTAFGAGSVVFDQIGTITVDGVNYIREGYHNENGYIAWRKASSNITLSDGNTYTYDQKSINYSGNEFYVTNYSGYTGKYIRYAWKDTVNNKTYFTLDMDPEVGDKILTSSSASSLSNITVTAVDSDYIYTIDSAEPIVGNTAYSDVSGTVLGTITAVA